MVEGTKDRDRQVVPYQMSLCKLLSEKILGETTRRQIFLGITTNRKLWRAMNALGMKGPIKECHVFPYNDLVGFRKFESTRETFNCISYKRYISKSFLEINYPQQNYKTLLHSKCLMFFRCKI